MNNFFSEFDKQSLESWREQIVKDLKGKDPSILEFRDNVEEIEYRAYYHPDDPLHAIPKPGNYPYTRGINQAENIWVNAQLVTIEDEKEANDKALALLMKGADGIILKTNKPSTDWKTVLQDIKLEHIYTEFIISDLNDYVALQHFLGENDKKNVSFSIDLLAASQPDLGKLIDTIKNSQQFTFVVNGYEIQQCGATTWQELAFCLSTGHEYLVKLMNLGLSIDQAAACIHFNIGIGSNYFMEIAKLRAFRTLWSKVVHAYSPEHGCSHLARITATIGLMNKTLKDPYTNLLRQTTEAMSAIIGGANVINVLPYDSLSKTQKGDLAERMATNISLILREESFFSKVIDAAGGSYSVEYLTEEIGKRSWKLFQYMERNGGIHDQEVLDTFLNSVREKQALRVEQLNSGQAVLIGLNKFPNPDESNAEWGKTLNYLGLDHLIFEQHIKSEIYAKS